MDGLLIDSEPFWREALKTAFPKVGIDLTDEMCIRTMGLRINEVVAHWYKFKPWDSVSCEQLENEIIDTVGKLIVKKGEPLEGVDYILSFFRKKNMPVGLATSSAARLIDLVLQKLNLRDYFDVAHSAENEALGKPDPAVFITTAQKLNVVPSDCIAFEDSYNGLISAHAAGMKTVVVPESHWRGNARFGAADLQLGSLLEFTDLHFENLNRST